MPLQAPCPFRPGAPSAQPPGVLLSCQDMACSRNEPLGVQSTQAPGVPPTHLLFTDINPSHTVRKGSALPAKFVNHSTVAQVFDTEVLMFQLLNPHKPFSMYLGTLPGGSLLMQLVGLEAALDQNSHLSPRFAACSQESSREKLRERKHHLFRSQLALCQLAYTGEGNYLITYSTPVLLEKANIPPPTCHKRSACTSHPASPSHLFGLNGQCHLFL